MTAQSHQTPDIHVRSARPEDIGPMIELLRELFAIEQDFTFDASAQQRGLTMMLDDASTRQVWVACRKSGVVGMCTAQVVISTAQGGPVAWVEDVVVAEAERNQGIGRMLMQAVECWARHAGITRLQLLADSDNRHALEFYQRGGWQKTRLTGLRKFIQD